MYIVDTIGTGKFFRKIALLYFILLVVLALLRSYALPPIPVLLVQLCLIILTIAFSYSLDKLPNDAKRVILFVGVFLILASTITKVLYLINFNNILGYNPQDALVYHKLAERHFNDSLSLFLDKIRNVYGYDRDDLGFFCIVFCVYQAVGSPSIGIHVLLILNLIVILISSYYLYRLSQFFLSQRMSVFIAFLWGTQLFGVYTACVGLKENFFSATIILAMYNLYAYMYRRGVMKIINLLGFGVFSYLILFFRQPLFYMILLALFSIPFLRLPFVRKYLPAVMFILLILSSLLGVYFVDAVGADRDLSYDELSQMTEEKTSGGVVTYVTNYLGALIGPFPSFVSDPVKSNYITTYNFGSFCKMIYSFYALMAVWYIIVKRQVQYLPLILFIVLDSFMLVFCFYSLHDRYQWMHIPFVMILGGVGCEKFARYVRPSYKKAYIGLCLLFILIYNMRSF